MYRFLVVIEKANGNYSAYSPDLPGCVATGTTREEAEKNMYESIELHILGLQEDRLPIPESSSFAEYLALPAKGECRMGLTILEVEIAKEADARVWEKLEFLIDSGAVYSVVPTPVLEKMSIKPYDEQTFRLANGEKIVRKRGFSFFRFGGRKGVSDVIFGEPGDSNLFGVLTLESLGLALDPLKRELKPLPMILAGYRPPDIIQI